MPDLESQIRLALEMTGTKTAGEAADEIARLGKELGKTDAEIEESTRLLRYYQEVMRGATTEEDAAVKTAIQHTLGQRNLREALEETAQATEAQATVITTTANPAIKEAGIGFDTLTRNVFGAERAFTAMASGTGLARAGPMLDKVLGMLGGPAGLGFAIVGIEFALEKVIPLVEKLFSGGNSEAMKASADYWERISKAAEKLAATSTAAQKKSAGEINEFIGESNAQVIQDAIRNSMLRTAEKTRTPEEQALLDVAGPETGMTGAVAMHPLMAKAALQSRMNIKETTTQKAQELFTQLATDPSARARAAQMAIDRPGEFPPGFAQSMAGFTPEALEAADKDMEEVVAFGERAHDAGARRREHAKQVNRAAAETKRAAEERFQQEQKTEREQKAAEAKKAQQTAREAAQRYQEEQRKEREQKQAESQATRDDARAARENTPEKSKQRAIGAEIQAQGGATADPDFVHQVAGQASKNVTMGADIASAVRLAVQQVQMKIQADFIRGMHGMNQNMNAGMGYDPTQYGRGQ